MNIKLSVIIPVYNAEKYISTCMESLIHQIPTQARYELVVIDDGSFDKSLDICREYENNFSFIHVFHQTNQGVSCARNLGIQRAQGEYVTFVDADDWVEKDFINTIIQNIDNTDVFIFDGFVNKHNIASKNHFWFKDTTFDKNKSLLIKQIVAVKFKNEYVPKYNGVGIAWGKAIKRKLLIDNEISFIAGQKMGEDNIFYIEVFSRAKTIVYRQKCLYHYRCDNVSACRSFDRNYIKTNAVLVDNMKKALEKIEISDNDIQNAFDFRKILNIISIIDNYLFYTEKKHQKKVFYSLFNEDWIADTLSSASVENLTKIKKIKYNLIKTKNYYLLKIVWSVEHMCRVLFYFARLRLNG